MEKNLADKLDRLHDLLRGMGVVAVAFSGGVDSTLLLEVAHETLGDAAFAVTAETRGAPHADLEAAERFCRERDIARHVLPFDELGVPGFAENPPDRCYLCKRALMGGMLELARARGATCLAEGSNVDDQGDWRPGLRAVAELGVASPLRDAGLAKADVRAAACELGLEAWDRPSAACLSSRFAYGERIDAERLERVGRAEDLLHGMGFRQVRVRVHGSTAELARIEAEPAEVGRLCSPEVRRRVERGLRDLGFSYVTADLAGFRSGSMNEVLGR